MASSQIDLFATPLLPGLAAAERFLAAAEEAALIALVDSARLAPFRFQQWLGKRLTASFGWHYDFERGTFAAAEPMPDALLPIRARAAAFAGLEADALVQALVIRYDPGAGIGWHRDRPMFDHVVGLSLGAPAAMRFRRRTGERDGRIQYRRETQPLEPRSIYHLSGEARWDWEHSIAPIEETRWSVTFRSLSARERDERAR
ncbi:alpha-ketoglutarate-dependent dioxygenase AlkB [Sphingomonas sp. CARO-RG-8B-R24-01]|uniref:alpha-ketoglutarate-dependent dioxygenase AlkB n=1 Tax=Sphingomonas sp. CARO-RG-8B-R24-01 TaxID=2914831 RepID=UPI001F55D42C|nr:alpha-ketoglutarate-dependent dioxygenase AlkB [Sphingomonas sp. CARO-RG-8B-R24-01]